MSNKILTAILVAGCMTNVVYGQNFFDRAKQKAKDKIGKVTDSKPSGSTSGNSFANDGEVKADDPSPYGTVIIDKIITGSEGITSPYIETAKADGSGRAQVKYMYLEEYYNYSGGTATKSGESAHGKQIYITRNSEADYKAVDLSQSIYQPPGTQSAAAIVKSTPGKSTCSFKGKTFATYMMMTGMMRNADSSVIMTIGTKDGKKYTVNTSDGQEAELPTYAAITYMSPNGAHAGAMIQKATAADAMTNAKATIYMTGGAPVALSSYGEKALWLHNSGTVFAIDGANNKILKANDKLFHTFGYNMETSNLFISNDGKRVAWISPSRQLHCPDGKVFNVSSVYRIAGKDTLVFTAWTGNKFYMCQREM